MVKTYSSLVLICVMLTVASIAVAGQRTSQLVTAQIAKAEQPYHLCRDYKFDPAPFRSIVTLGDTVFLAEAGGRVRAISSQSNQTNWVSELGGSIVSMLADPGFGLYVVNSTSPNVGTVKTTLRRLDAESGLAKFSIDLAGNRGNFLGISAADLIISDKEGNLLKVNSAIGTSIWKTRINGRIVANPAYGQTMVAIATDDKKIEFLDSQDGSRVSSIVTKREITSLAFRANQMIVAGDDRGNVTNYRDQFGSVWWQFKSGGRVGTIAETDEGILVGSFDNFLYMISKYSGDVKWKRRLEGRIVQQPAVGKSEIVVTISTESDTVVLDTSNGKIVEQILLGDRSYPVSDPLFSKGSMLFVPVSTGLVAFSRTGCK